LLFVLQGPRERGPSHERAFDRVRNALDAAQIPHLAADALPDILAFARREE